MARSEPFHCRPDELLKTVWRSWCVRWPKRSALREFSFKAIIAKIPRAEGDTPTLGHEEFPATVTRFLSAGRKSRVVRGSCATGCRLRGYVPCDPLAGALPTRCEGVPAKIATCQCAEPIYPRRAPNYPQVPKEPQALSYALVCAPSGRCAGLRFPDRGCMRRRDLGHRARADRLQVGVDDAEPCTLPSGMGQGGHSAGSSERPAAAEQQSSARRSASARPSR